MAKEAAGATYKLSVSPNYGEPHQEITAVLKRADRNAHGPIYNVFVGGECIGRVRKGTAIMERRPKGARFVTKRWDAVRWFGECPTNIRNGRYAPKENRKRATEEVVEAWLSKQPKDGEAK